MDYGTGVIAVRQTRRLGFTSEEGILARSVSSFSFAEARRPDLGARAFEEVYARTSHGNIYRIGLGRADMFHVTDANCKIDLPGVPFQISLHVGNSFEVLTPNGLVVSSHVTEIIGVSYYGYDGKDLKVLRRDPSIEFTGIIGEFRSARKARIK